MQSRELANPPLGQDMLIASKYQECGRVPVLDRIESESVESFGVEAYNGVRRIRRDVFALRREDV